MDHPTISFASNTPKVFAADMMRINIITAASAARLHFLSYIA